MSGVWFSCLIMVFRQNRAHVLLLYFYWKLLYWNVIRCNAAEILKIYIPGTMYEWGASQEEEWSTYTGKCVVSDEVAPRAGGRSRRHGNSFLYALPFATRSNRNRSFELPQAFWECVVGNVIMYSSVIRQLFDYSDRVHGSSFVYLTNIRYTFASRYSFIQWVIRTFSRVVIRSATNVRNVYVHKSLFVHPMSIQFVFVNHHHSSTDEYSVHTCCHNTATEYQVLLDAYSYASGVCKRSALICCFFLVHYYVFFEFQSLRPGGWTGGINAPVDGRSEVWTLDRKYTFFLPFSSVGKSGRACVSRQCI